MRRKKSKNTIRRTLFSLLLFGILFPALAQSPWKVKKTIRGEVLLPRAISNKAFKQLFSGVFATNISMNFGVNNFNTGIYYGLMQSQIFPKFLSDPHSIQTVHSTGIRLAYDIYPSSKTRNETQGNFIVTTPFISGGLAQVDYSRLKCITGAPAGKNTLTYSIYSGANFTLMFSDYDGVGFTLGYNFINHEFNPDDLCLDQYFPNIPDKDKHGLAQFIYFGFNVYFDLVNRDNE